MSVCVWVGGLLILTLSEVKGREGGATLLSALIHQRETKMLCPQSASHAAQTSMKVFTVKKIWQIC